MFARHYSHNSSQHSHPFEGAAASATADLSVPDSPALDPAAPERRPALRLVPPPAEPVGAPSPGTDPGFGQSVVRLSAWPSRKLFASEAGMATAEYAIATLATVHAIRRT